MVPVIKANEAQIKIGRKQSYKNLALFPLLSEYEGGLETLTLDAIDRFEPKKEYEVRRGDVTPFLKGAATAGIEGRPSLALGTGCRISSDRLTGFARALDGQVLHLAMFARNYRGNGPGNGSRMLRASARRRRIRYEEPEE